PRGALHSCSRDPLVVGNPGLRLGQRDRAAHHQRTGDRSTGHQHASYETAATLAAPRCPSPEPVSPRAYWIEIVHGGARWTENATQRWSRKRSSLANTGMPNTTPTTWTSRRSSPSRPATLRRSRQLRATA